MVSLHLLQAFASTLKAWPRIFYEHTLYSFRPPSETGVLLLLASALSILDY